MSQRRSNPAAEKSSFTDPTGGKFGPLVGVVAADVEVCVKVVDVGVVGVVTEEVRG
jgi:hypothetical protein